MALGGLGTLLTTLEALIPEISKLRSRGTVGKLGDLYLTIDNLKGRSSSRRALTRKIRRALEGGADNVELSREDALTVDALLELWKELRSAL